MTGEHRIVIKPEKEKKNYESKKLVESAGLNPFCLVSYLSVRVACHDIRYLPWHFSDHDKLHRVFSLLTSAMCHQVVQAVPDIYI